jgi:hypothetical protein
MRKKVLNASVSEDLLHIPEHGENQLLFRSALRTSDLGKESPQCFKGETMQKPDDTFQYDMDLFAV